MKSIDSCELNNLREETIASEQVFNGAFLNILRDQVRLPDGKLAQREYIVHPGAVMIVPILDNGELVVERQWRHPLARVMWEFPAGKLDAAEPPQHCAARELREETGYSAREWARAGVLHNAIAYSTEGIDVWFARGLTLGERQLDDGEHLDVTSRSLDELNALACTGDLTDAKTLVGLLWLQHWRAGQWPLVWQTVDV
jgi:ADP-ribose pyrophosphatase